MKKDIITIIVLALILLAIGFLIYGYVQKVTYHPQNPIVTMEIKDMGTIKMELYPDVAPNTVANFVKLINDGFYNNLTFHRTIPDFMIQGGDPNGDGSGGTEYGIPGEFSSNGYKNNLSHVRGTLSMARSDYTNISQELTKESYNSAGSQFFIMTKDNTGLDGVYGSFGKVIEGMDIVDKIVNLDVVTREQGSEGVDKPVTPPVIASMTVDIFGVNYGAPKTVEKFNYSNWLMQNYGYDLSTMGQ